MTLADLAAEAEFQLLVAKDNLEWMTGLAGAIHLSHTHGGGRDADALAGLAKYLDDTNFGGIESAIKQFREVHKKSAAPRNQPLASRGAAVSGASPQTLGERLVLAREAASLSQVELAKRVGIKQGTLSQIELGISKRTSYLPEIARACGVDIGWLAFGQGVAA